jgi:putative aldouronate transport system substrate-binding protein
LSPPAFAARSYFCSCFSTRARSAGSERALMLIDLAHQDQEVYDLMKYGIEGVNYKLTADGAVDTSFVDLSVDGFNYFSGALFGDKLLERAKTSDWAEAPEPVKLMESRAITNILDGFVLDTSNIEAEYTAINQVRVEYAFPLQAGLVDDVDAAYLTLLDKSNQAGLEACRAEIEREVNEFQDSRGIQ